MSLECYFCREIAAIDELTSDLVWQFPCSVAFLGPWQFYQGYCILACRQHATELSQLDDETRLNFLDEMCLLAKAVEDCFEPRKLNYEMLGNQTPHMHWHIIPRYRGDPDAPHSIWQAIDRVKDDRSARQLLKRGTADRAQTIAALRQQLRALNAPGQP